MTSDSENDRFPCDYQELSVSFKGHLSQVAAERSCSSAELVAGLKQLNFLESYDLEEAFPSKVSWDEVVSFLGITDEEWNAHLKMMCTQEWAEVRPCVLSGDAGPGPAESWDMGAIYRGPDILRVVRWFDAFEVPYRKTFFPALRVLFQDSLDKALASVKVQAPSWPKDLPRNDTELHAMYGAYVFDQVRRISRIKTDQELKECTQQVWLNLINSEVLAKFLQAATTKLPRTLTVSEVCGYLGITWTQWVNAMSYHHRKKAGWMPVPVKGKPFSKDALYLTEDVQTLDSSGFLQGKRNEVRQGPDFSGRGFKSYLAQAVRNHFKNLVRTRTRRHKERGIGPNVLLVPDSSGAFSKAHTQEENIHWEDYLADTSDVEMESLIDLAHNLRRHGVDPRTSMGVNVLDAMTKGMTLKTAIKQNTRQIKMSMRQTG